MNGTSIKATIQGLQISEIELLEGTVVSASPITVKADNDNQILNSNVLSVPERFRAYSGSCSISGGAVTGSTSDGASLTGFTANGAAITISTPLNAGDKVMLIAYNRKKKYYILDRV